MSGNRTPPKAPIRVYDPTITLLGEVDIYESLFFTRALNGPGAFQIVINWNITDATGNLRYAALFALDNYIMINNDLTKCGIIVDVSKAIDEDGKASQK